MTRRFVIYTPELGVYLGNCMGMGFWSKLDPVGQPAAVTFETPDKAQQHVNTWDTKPAAILLFVAVVADVGADEDRPSMYWASVTACVAAGLPAWDAEVTTC